MSFAEFCPKCGTPTLPASEYCAHCGTQLTWTPSPAAGAPPSSGRNVAIGAGIVGGVALLVLVLLSILATQAPDTVAPVARPTPSATATPSVPPMPAPSDHYDSDPGPGASGGLPPVDPNYDPFDSQPVQLTEACAATFAAMGVSTVDPNGAPVHMSDLADQFYEVVVMPNPDFRDQPTTEAFLDAVYGANLAGAFDTSCLANAEVDFYAALTWHHGQRLLTQGTPTPTTPPPPTTDDDGLQAI